MVDSKSREPKSAQMKERLTFGEQLHQDLEKATAEEDKAIFEPEGMLKCFSELAARSFAKERGRYYGNNSWYVGTLEQLAAIGCVNATKVEDVEKVYEAGSAELLTIQRSTGVDLGGQLQINTSPLPTISKEERALLDTAEKLMWMVECGGMGRDEVCAYREAEANFMATRKEF